MIGVILSLSLSTLYIKLITNKASITRTTTTTSNRPVPLVGVPTVGGAAVVDVVGDSVIIMGGVLAVAFETRKTETETNAKFSY